MGEEEEREPEPERGGGISIVPVFQVVLCALVLLALVICKATDPKAYQDVQSWYRTEAAREIELPRFGEREVEPTPTPEPPPASSTARAVSGELMKV